MHFPIAAVFSIENGEIRFIIISFFLKSLLCGHQYVCVCVCPLPRLHITSGMIWTLYYWLITSCFFSVPIYGSCQAWPKKQFMEHIICHNIMNHLESNHILNEYQYGFRPSHSCQAQL